jgi:hypothetical protein
MIFVIGLHDRYYFVHDRIDQEDAFFSFFPLSPFISREKGEIKAINKSIHLHIFLSINHEEY